jgi:hypothetical protein
LDSLSFDKIAVEAAVTTLLAVDIEELIVRTGPTKDTGINRLLRPDLRARRLKLISRKVKGPGWGPVLIVVRRGICPLERTILGVANVETPTSSRRTARDVAKATAPDPITGEVVRDIDHTGGEGCAGARASRDEVDIKV